MEPTTPVPVVVETSRYRIRGSVAVPTEERLSDYANAGGRDFFAVTDALVAPLDNPERERKVGFILVARHEIGVMLPAELDEKPVEHDEARERTADHLWSFMEQQ